MKKNNIFFLFGFILLITLSWSLLSIDKQESNTFLKDSDPNIAKAGSAVLTISDNKPVNEKKSLLVLSKEKMNTQTNLKAEPVLEEESHYKEIIGFIKKGESLYDIFKKNSIDISPLYEISQTAKNKFNLKKIKPGMSYQILIDSYSNDIIEFKYSIDDSSFLSVEREGNNFIAKKTSIDYQKEKGTITGTIDSNLIDSIGYSSEHYKVAYELSDIFSWDIDFNTDLRKGDTYKLILEERYREDIFKGYGEIIYAEFINNGKKFEAFRYNIDGKYEYFDENGNSLRKALLRAPLKFRYISSHFSNRRKHPILKIYRPHHGIDYAAPLGTPVSAAGDGKVTFAAYKGQSGKLIIIKHPGGYKTYYCHLLKFAKGVRKGVRVTQGQIIGYVGSTGLSTGPHLDYRVKLHGRPINPLKMRLPSSKPVPNKYKNDFKEFVNDMRNELSTRTTSLVAFQPAFTK